MPQTTPIKIAVINASTIIEDDDIPPVIQALQQQVTNDFLPAWGVDANLSFVAAGSTPPAGSWWLSILDDSDQAGALGYHDLTPDGLPLGKVFAATDLKYGNSWSVTASHELLEMLADPNINLTVLVQNANTSGTLFAYEVCDACEADNLGYKIGSVLVSDFVYPSWFEDFRAKGSTQFDKCDHIQEPFELLPEGYIGIFKVSDGTGWTQLTAEKNLTNTLFRGDVGTRRERRRIPRQHWVRSRSHREIVHLAQLYQQRLQQIGTRKAAA